MVRYRVGLWIIAASWSATAMPAAVTIDGQSATLTPLLPARGTYYDATKSGTGIAVDVSQNGFVFLTYYGYDAMGVPTWYSVQGQWSPATEAQRIASGVIGTLNQPLLRSSGGQCLACDFTSKPTIAPQPYTVSASWTTPRHVDITIGSQTWHMDAGQFGTAEADLFTGTWQASVSWGYDSRIEFVVAQPIPTQTGTVVLGVKHQISGPPVGFNVIIGSLDADPSIQLPPKGAYFYDVSTRHNCAPLPEQPPFQSGAFSDLISAIPLPPPAFIGPPGPNIVPMFWYDPATRRGGLDIAAQYMGVDATTMVLGPNNVHFDLYVEPDRIVGHGVAQGKNVNLIPGLYWMPTSVTLNLVMQRLPAGVTEGAVRNLVCAL